MLIPAAIECKLAEFVAVFLEDRRVSGNKVLGALLSFPIDKDPLCLVFILLSFVLNHDDFAKVAKQHLIKSLFWVRRAHCCGVGG